MRGVRGTIAFFRAAPILLAFFVPPVSAQERDVRVILPLQLDAKPTDDFERVETPRAKPVDLDSICRLITTSADEQGLPRPFLARLLWKESRFDPGYVSRTGERGIAQFLPGTAFDLGLRDSFDAEQAVPALAAHLADLSARYGNIGLAAAAWDAGTGKVDQWMEKGGFLPIGTEDYMLAVLGQLPVVYRKAANVTVPPLEAGRSFEESCPSIPELGDDILLNDADRPAWGAQIAGHFSRDVAESQWQALRQQHPALLGDVEPAIFSARTTLGRTRRFVVQIAAESQIEAEAVCENLRIEGAACVVTRN